MSTPLSFNASWYLSQNPDVAAAIQAGAPFNAFEHFTLYGRAENRSASPVFDAQEYLSNNPDVAEAVAQGLITAWDHFELFGGAEGRSPTPLFNEAFYLQQNPDVAAAIAQGIISSAAQHFALFGQSEPRAINPAINLGQYLSANPDIAQAAANGLINPLDHLMQYGVTEGRSLGNGVSLGDFSSDPGFSQSLSGGNPVQALIRVEAVAPFIPTFERPAGWTPPANTPIPVDFVPPAGSGIQLVVPPEVVVPPDVVLPPVFDPVTPPAPTPPGGGGEEIPAPLTLALKALSDELYTVTGTKWDDTFTAANSDSLKGIQAKDVNGVPTAGLVLDGGAGTDKLVATLTADLDEIKPFDFMPTISGVETFELTVTDDSKSALGLMFSRIQDVHTIVNKGSTSNLTITDVRKVVDLSVVAMADDTPRDFAVRYGQNLEHSGTQSLTLDNANLNLLTITKLNYTEDKYVSVAPGISTMAIAVTGDNGIRTFDEPNVAADLYYGLTKISVSGEGKLKIDELPSGLIAFDASSNIGGVDVVSKGTAGIAMTGGSGNDILTAGSGNDILTGGGGADTFKIVSIANNNASRPVVKDYSFLDGDIVDISGVDYSGISGGLFANFEFRTGARDDVPGTENDFVIELIGDSHNNSTASSVIVLEEKAGSNVRVALGDQLKDTALAGITEAIIGQGVTSIVGDSSAMGGQLLIGGDGNQTITSGLGNDVIIGGKGDDTINLTAQGSGSDTLLYSVAKGGKDTILGFRTERAGGESNASQRDTILFSDATSTTPITISFVDNDGYDGGIDGNTVDVTVFFNSDNSLTFVDFIASGTDLKTLISNGTFADGKGSTISGENIYINNNETITLTGINLGDLATAFGHTSIQFMA